jgi:hypothetical protein
MTVFYAAAHVVAASETEVDWDATLAFRHRLWDLGLGVADAMDTAQRGMGLDWPVARELIRRSGAEAKARGGRIACGVATDQLAEALATGRPAELKEIIRAYAEQLEVAEGAGVLPVLMCSRQLAATARGPEDYAEVYDALLRQASGPVVLHWLGDMFDPTLAGYWTGRSVGAGREVGRGRLVGETRSGKQSHEDLDEATGHFLAIVAEHADKIDGIKVSLLDAAREIAIRGELPSVVRCYTGDDFNFPQLIESGSDALLGAFDPLAGPAAAALRRLDAGDAAGFRAILDPLVPLSRTVFEAPTRYYKTGVTFLAWLSGFQDRFVMIGGYQSARDAEHLRRLYAMAGQAGLFPDPGLAKERFDALA